MKTKVGSILRTLRKPFTWVARRLSPTALCEEHERIHRELAVGKDARRELRRLRWWRPLLCLLPTYNNIRIRHLLTIAGLRRLGRLDMYGAAALRGAASSLWEACTGGGYLPHIEGWDYAGYIAKSARWLDKAGVSTIWLDELAARQAAHASARALPSGEVPDHDTRRSSRVEPSSDPFYTCEAYTVWRRGLEYFMVQHDARIRHWRFRWNLHVANSFGVMVRTAEDWPFWYPEAGWSGKRIAWRDIAWRFWPSRMEVLERSNQRVVLRVDRRIKVFRPCWLKS